MLFCRRAGYTGALLNLNLAGSLANSAMGGLIAALFGLLSAL